MRRASQGAASWGIAVDTVDGTRLRSHLAISAAAPPDQLAPAPWSSVQHSAAQQPPSPLRLWQLRLQMKPMPLLPLPFAGAQAGPAVLRHRQADVRPHPGGQRQGRLLPGASAHARVGGVGVGVGSALHAVHLGFRACSARARAWAVMSRCLQPLHDTIHRACIKAPKTAPMHAFLNSSTVHARCLQLHALNPAFEVPVAPQPLRFTHAACSSMARAWALRCWL